MEKDVIYGFFMALPHFSRTPPPSFFLILPTNHFIPKGPSLIRKNPTPFTKESLIERRKTIPLSFCLRKQLPTLLDEVFAQKPHLPIESPSKFALTSI